MPQPGPTQSRRFRERPQRGTHSSPALHTEPSAQPAETTGPGSLGDGHAAPLGCYGQGFYCPLLQVSFGCNMT